MQAWDVAPTRIDELRESIQRVQCTLALREVLGRDFPKDCASLPIAGGWGYSQADAVKFIRHKFSRPNSPHFVELEYLIAQKVIYEELIIFQPRGSQFVGIEQRCVSQSLLGADDRKFDRLRFSISCWSETHWNQLKEEWESERSLPGFDLAKHEAKRQASRIAYERELWFDITGVFDR